MKILIEGATIWNGADRLFENGAIIIDPPYIEAVLTRDELALYDIPLSIERIDGMGKLAIPGLVNAHTHLYSTLARGMTVSGFAPRSFCELLQQLWWRVDRALDKEDIYMSGLVGAMAAARCGVTTLIDHHSSPNAVSGSLTELQRAVTQTVGLRGAFAYEISDRNGPHNCQEGIAENLAFLAELSAIERMTAASIGLHASFTLSDKTLERVAQQVPGCVGIHIHVAEGPEDEEDCQRRYGMRIVERLQYFNLLKPQSILAHCVHLNEKEQDLIAQSNAIIVHNPRSNMNNGIGALNLRPLLEQEIVVGLGSDGLGANILAELLTAALLQRHIHADTCAIDPATMQQILFTNNYTIVQRLFGIEIGKIAAGALADIALIDYYPSTPLRCSNISGHLFFGLAAGELRVSALLVDGRIIIKQGEFTAIDEREIAGHAQVKAEELWNRVI